MFEQIIEGLHVFNDEKYRNHGNGYGTGNLFKFGNGGNGYGNGKREAFAFNHNSDYSPRFLFI